MLWPQCSLSVLLWNVIINNMASVLFQTTGIVLSRRDHKEVDRGYSVFTRQHGKIDFLARGGHKPLAKLTPHLEMVAEVDLLLVKGRVYYTVASVERCRSFSNIYQDFSRLLLAQSSLHLLDIGTKVHEQDTRLYHHLVEWLTFLNTATDTFSPERSGFLLGSFALKLLALTGYQPQLRACIDCESAIRPGAYRWHALKGGVVCEVCCKRNETQWFSARSMSDETLKLLRFALNEPFDAQLRPMLPGQILLDFHEAIESLIISHAPTIPANTLRASCLV